MKVDRPFDPLDSEVRGALQAIHEKLEASCFDNDWTAACRDVEAPAREPRPFRFRARFLRRPQAWAAAAVLMALGAGIVMRVPPADPAPEETAPAGVDAQVFPVVWYAPTDELLQVSSLHYSARPAAMTLYDPIDLEVRP